MLHRRLPRIDLPGHAYYLGCCLEARRRLFKNPLLAQYLLQRLVYYGNRKWHGHLAHEASFHGLEARATLPANSCSNIRDSVDLYVALRDRAAIKLHGYVIMPDHYHVILSLCGENSISGVVRAVHSLFARYCRKVTGIRGRIWQRRFYDHVIRDDEDWLTKLAYIHGNPVSAGLVEKILDYPWSSCRFWETGEGPLKCDRGQDALRVPSGQARSCPTGQGPAQRNRGADGSGGHPKILLCAPSAGSGQVSASSAVRARFSNCFRKLVVRSQKLKPKLV